MIIAFVGLKGSGKSAAADHVVNRWGGVKRSFAGPLKRATVELFALPHQSVYTREGKASKVLVDQRWDPARVRRAAEIMFSITRRDLDQDRTIAHMGGAQARRLLYQLMRQGLPKLGHGVRTVRELLQLVGTEIGREVFGEDMWVNSLIASIDPDKYITVIDDCRFANEAEAVRAAGGVVIGIDRPGCQIDDHPSELEMVQNWSEMVDVTIANAGTLEELFAMVDAVCADVMVPAGQGPGEEE